MLKYLKDILNRFRRQRGDGLRQHLSLVEAYRQVHDSTIEAVKEFALCGWELSDTHGLSHWLRVERNGVLLGTELHNGELHFRDGINIRVVRLFAYLHDKCRIDDGADVEHGARAASMLYIVRKTLLKELTDEEFCMLETACRLHTTEHKTGNATIDTCFDADRLDLGRVGITPRPTRMASAQGEYYASYSDLFV